MSTRGPKSPDWTDLLKIKHMASQSHKRKKEHVTTKQREVMLNFILENPEMVTHSSTIESEVSLWNDLTNELNSLLPEKSVGSWQIFWRRWKNNIELKSESSLTLIDYKLKKFLTNITANNETSLATQSCNKRKLTLDEICDCIKEVEEKRTKLQFAIDKMEYSVTLYQAKIFELKKGIALNRKECRQLSIRKSNLNLRKRKIEEKENTIDN